MVEIYFWEVAGFVSSHGNFLCSVPVGIHIFLQGILYYMLIYIYYFLDVKKKEVFISALISCLSQFSQVHLQTEHSWIPAPEW